MRYEVTTISGFLSAGGTGHQGTTYHVIDRLWNHRIVASWRTEDFGHGGRSKDQKARGRAEAYAAALNAGQVPVYGYGTGRTGFQPTCPREECATRCDADALYCGECGTRLYTMESGRYARSGDAT